MVLLWTLKNDREGILGDKLPGGEVYYRPHSKTNV
jgi:hypothetical protein